MTIVSPYLDTEHHLSPRTLTNMRGLHLGPKWARAGARVLYTVSDLEKFIHGEHR